MRHGVRTYAKVGRWYQVALPWLDPRCAGACRLAAYLPRRARDREAASFSACVDLSKHALDPGMTFSA